MRPRIELNRRDAIASDTRLHTRLAFLLRKPIRERRRADLTWCIPYLEKYCMLPLLEKWYLKGWLTLHGLYIQPDGRQRQTDNLPHIYREGL